MHQHCNLSSLVKKGQELLRAEDTGGCGGMHPSRHERKHLEVNIIVHRAGDTLVETDSHGLSQGNEAHREAHTSADETKRKEQWQKRERSDKRQKGNCQALTPTSCATAFLTKATEHNLQ